MTRLFVGCAVSRFPGAGYFNRLSLIDYSFRDPHPGTVTLKRWKKLTHSAVGQEPHRVVLTLPREKLVTKTGFLRYDEGDEKRTWIEDSIRTIHPQVICIPTGTDLTPSVRERDRFLAFVSDLRKIAPTTRFVWDPKGMWDDEDALEFAAASNLTLAINDPQGARAVAADKFAFLRLSAIGIHARLSDEFLYNALHFAQTCGDAVLISLESARSYPRALRLLDLANELGMLDQIDDIEKAFGFPPPDATRLMELAEVDGEDPEYPAAEDEVESFEEDAADEPSSTDDDEEE